MQINNHLFSIKMNINPLLYRVQCPTQYTQKTIILIVTNSKSKRDKVEPQELNKFFKISAIFHIPIHMNHWK